MRQALRGLTTRGRAFVAAGITASLCALLLGQKDLLRVGILLVALPIVAALVVGRTRLRLQVRRSLAPDQVPVGTQATVELTLTNQGRMPAGLLLLEDRIPYVLGHRPRFVVDRVSPNWRRTVSYPVKSDVRGLFQVGPLMLTVADPFGLVETSRTFTRSQHLLVTPRVYRLPEVRLGADRAGSGENRPRAIASAGEEDATVREYRDGDDLRRVHWRSTARRGSLMVRREEQPWQSRCAIFLDARTIFAPRAWTVVQSGVGGQRCRLDRRRPDPARLCHHPARWADHVVGDQPSQLAPPFTSRSPAQRC